MKNFAYTTLLLVLCTISSSIFCKSPIKMIRATNNAADAQWAVVGAGPAGIATIGILLDLGVPASQIFWLDPEFNVGRMGQFYTSVPGNAKTMAYVNFIKACTAFCDCNSPAIEALYNIDPNWECELGTIVAALHDITNHLLTKVHGVRNRLTSLDFEDDMWRIGTSESSFTANRVVLATGAHPRTLDYDCKNEIPLDYALDKSWLAHNVTPQDTVAVIGSAHSAVLLLKYLDELSAGRVINFYIKPLTYAVDTTTWELNGKEGLSGMTAEWAFHTLSCENPPAKIVRMKNTQQTRDAWLPIATKIIYAVGYDRNEIPNFNGSQKITYDSHSGVIAPHLFGIGIAFPEQSINSDGVLENHIGLKAFMDYAQRVIPQWQFKHRAHLIKDFDELFTIQQL